MTAQVSDVVVYHGLQYALVEAEGSGLFEPGVHGLHVEMITTACWRGYICEYTVEDDRLSLTSLQIGVAEPPSELFGAQVRRGGIAAQYGPFRAQQTFTGRLQLGAGFIHELYEHMGHHPAWKYATVLEVVFEDGRLKAVHDQSELMAQRRAAETQTRQLTQTTGLRRRLPLGVRAFLWILAGLALGTLIAQGVPIASFVVIFGCSVAFHLIRTARREKVQKRPSSR